ncbi:MAG: HAD-IIIA family hydrolase [Deltaproteobacteria bacterium]|nr:HAD-IIIA family hydrolase [Deltaproteobacteria bacterium]
MTSGKIVNGSEPHQDAHPDFSKIALFACDVDGVMTDGGLYFDDAGHHFRRFDIKDGMGVIRLRKAGLHVAIISGASSEAMRARAESLGITEIHLGIADKGACLGELAERYDLPLEQVLYMGDDVIDLPALRIAGVACAPRDAINEVRECANYVTSAPGGRGAVREVCELILEARSPNAVITQEPRANRCSRPTGPRCDCAQTKGSR